MPTEVASKMRWVLQRRQSIFKDSILDEVDGNVEGTWGSLIPGDEVKGVRGDIHGFKVPRLGIYMAIARVIRLESVLNS
jgi:hypothetical protein